MRMCIFCCTFASANRQLQIDFLDHFYKYNYMTQNLSHISHVAPPDVPSEEDLQFEVQDLLRHANSPIDVLQKINQITCPYYRKALAQIVPIHWHHMERNGIEPAVYMDADSEWRITWINIDYDIRRIIKQANTEQVEREQQEQSSIEKTVSITTKTTTFMPLFINKHEGTINHNEYHNCTIYQGTPMPQNEPEPQNDNNRPIAPSLFCLDKHAISVIEQKIKEALDVPTKTKACANLYALQREGYINLDQYHSDLERAQALNQYQTTHIFCADDLQRGRAKR